MQLCLYDITNKKHVQLTHDTSNKDESLGLPVAIIFWLPMEQTGLNRIAMYNLHQRIHFIT